MTPEKIPTSQVKMEGESGISSDTEPGIEGFKPFEKKVTIKIPVYDRGVEGLPPVDDNYWTKWIQKISVTNII